MKPIDPSVDDLMWLIADQNEAAATESFCKRYPQHRDEMHKRIRLVNGIRANRPVAPVAAATPPAFEARPVRSNSTPQIWWTVGLLAFFTMTYAFSRFAFAPPAAKPTEVVVNNPVVNSGLEPKPAAGPDETAHQNFGTQSNPAPQAAPKPLTPMERRVSLEASESSLVQVLNKISLQSGVQFQLAPGVNDMPLALGFEDRTVAEALTDIAIALNISFLEQEPGNVLIIPAGNQGPVTENSGG
ncbi:MAG: hypothetical protein JNJ45_06390 [Chthonomonas sp.]|nr:hypothetical protein [Chthonomonas sp.]